MGPNGASRVLWSPFCEIKLKSVLMHLKVSGGQKSIDCMLESRVEKQPETLMETAARQLLWRQQVCWKLVFLLGRRGGEGNALTMASRWPQWAQVWEWEQKAGPDSLLTRLPCWPGGGRHLEVPAARVGNKSGVSSRGWPRWKGSHWVLSLAGILGLGKLSSRFSSQSSICLSLCPWCKLY